MQLGIFCTLDHYPDLGIPPRGMYRRAIEEAVLAEDVGLESFWITEHHFSDYGIVPEPSLLLCAIAERTERLRLGTATAVLPFDHPLRAAERYALLDQLSGGRLEFGAGAGYLQYEFAGFGLDPAERRTRFDETLAVIRRAWAGGPVAYAGRHIHVDSPPLNVRPLQAGGPPIHIGVTRPQAAHFIGRQGHRLAIVPYIALRNPDELADVIGAYRAALPAGAVGEVSAVFHCFCGAGPGDPDRAAAESALQHYLRTRVVPGARYTGDAICRDFVLIGDATAVEARLSAYAAMGVDRALLLTSFGGLAPSAVSASLQRLGGLATPLARRGPASGSPAHRPGPRAAP